MSFHTTISTNLPPVLINTLSAQYSDLGQYYAGRRRRTVTRTDGEVWIEPLPNEDVGTGLQRLTRRPYMVHVLSPTTNRGGAGAGAAQIAEVEVEQRAIVAALNGTRSMHSADARIVGIAAEDVSLDADPEDPKRVEGTVRVTFLTRDDP